MRVRRRPHSNDRRYWGRTPATVDHAFAHAALLVGDADVTGAATLIKDVIASAPPGNAGWTLLIEPLLGVARNRGAWTSALAVLKARAS